MLVAHLHFHKSGLALPSTYWAVCSWNVYLRLNWLGFKKHRRFVASAVDCLNDLITWHTSPISCPDWTDRSRIQTSLPTHRLHARIHTARDARQSSMPIIPKSAEADADGAAEREAEYNQLKVALHLAQVDRVRYGEEMNLAMMKMQ